MRLLAAVVTALTLANPLHALEGYGAIGGDYALPHAGSSDMLISVLGGVAKADAPLAFGAEAEFGLEAVRTQLMALYRDLLKDRSTAT